MTDADALRSRLLQLLARASDETRLSAELSRARREFFGAEEPEYAADEREMEGAAIRFAEWYLLERDSEVLGRRPVAALSAAGDPGPALDPSTVGVWMVESAADREVRLRDLQGKPDAGRAELRDAPPELQPGDVLIGRLYGEVGEEALLPSPALAILRAAPELAVAFQRDIKALGLDRRLTQAELEHLLFRRGASANPQGQGSTEPVERLEARLQAMIAAADLDDELPVTEISRALAAAPSPGPVAGPLMDRFAIETEVDLEELRQLLIDLWTSLQHSPGKEDAAQAKPQGRPKPVQTDPKAIEEGPGLGARVLARIDEGLAAEDRDVEAVFDEVGRMLGGGDSGTDEEDADPIRDEGDLAPLVREFAWERGVPSEEEAVLARFLALQNEHPVPRTTLEELDADDVLRFLLQLWYGAPAKDRRALAEESFAVLERFWDWAVETQGIERGGTISDARTRFVDHLERLDQASRALSTSDDPQHGGRLPELIQVLAVDASNGTVHLALGSERHERQARVTDTTAALLAEQDILVGQFLDQGEGGGTFAGMVVVVPGLVEHLLG